MMAAPPPSGPPPPYTPGKQPPNVVVVQQTVHIQQKPQKKGFFSSIVSEVDRFGKQMGRELDNCATKINQEVDKHHSSPLLGLFGHGNLLQLISRSSGKTVQILLNVSGHMILDATGPLDPHAVNTLWTVVNQGNNQVRLYNNNNYLAIIKGCATVVPLMPGTIPGLDTLFQLSQIDQQFVALESMSHRSHYLGFLRTGEVKPALATGKEIDGQFGVKLVSTPYPTTQVVKVQH